MTFDIPQTPENLAAMAQLKSEALCSPVTLYLDKDNGVIPVMDLKMNPNCPDKELYKGMLDFIMSCVATVYDMLKEE